MKIWGYLRRRPDEAQRNPGLFGEKPRIALRYIRYLLHRINVELGLHRCSISDAVPRSVASPDSAALHPGHLLHPKVDICDTHAKADRHGLGAGVYPINAHPYLGHPQPSSFLTYVFSEEVSTKALS